MNVTLKKLAIDPLLFDLGWPRVRDIIEMEAVNHGRGCIANALRSLRRQGYRGEHAYALNFKFDLGQGIVGQLPSLYIVSREPGERITVDIFAVWDIQLTGNTRGTDVREERARLG